MVLNHLVKQRALSNRCLSNPLWGFMERPSRSPDGENDLVGLGQNGITQNPDEIRYDESQKIW